MSETNLSGRLRVVILESVVEAFSLSVAGEKIPASVGEALSDFNLPPRSTSHLLDVWGRIHADLLREPSSTKVDRVRERLKASRRVSGLDHFSGFDAVVADMISALEASIKRHHVVVDIEEEVVAPAKKRKARKKKESVAVAPAKKRKARAAKFEHYIDASNRAVELGIPSSHVYQHKTTDDSGVVIQARYKEDPRLPAQPPEVYPETWALYHDPWNVFLQNITPESSLIGGEPQSDVDSQGYYRTWRLAAFAARTVQIMSKKDYRDFYGEDPRLPKNPQEYYKGEWPGWRPFILPKYDLKEAAQACRRLGITNHATYKEKYKKALFLPSHSILYVAYKKAGLGWAEFLALCEPSDT